MDMSEIYLEKYMGAREYSRFENRFKACRKRGFGFDPFAFILGPVYLFYKKMYREGAAFLVLMLTVSTVLGTAAGIFAMGLDTSGYAMYDYGLVFKDGFSYFDLTPGEIFGELTAAPVYVGETETLCVYGRSNASFSQMTILEMLAMPLFDRSFYYGIESLPAFAFWAGRIITNVILCLLLNFRFDVIYYRKMSGLAARQLSGVREGAPECSRLEIMERACGEKPCHPLYVLMGLCFFGVLFPLPLPFLETVCKAALGLLMFPVVSAADYIFGDMNVRLD